MLLFKYGDHLFSPLPITMRNDISNVTHQSTQMNIGLLGICGYNVNLHLFGVPFGCPHGTAICT